VWGVGSHKPVCIWNIRQPDIQIDSAKATYLVSGISGGIQSNHCRVVALACAGQNWACRLILHGSRDQFLADKGNALIMRAAGAQVEFVDAAEIGPAMEKAMEDFRTQGFRPYYLYGGGHNRAGVRAYEVAVAELKDILPPDDVPDHIFLASGTGSTQAGILAGCRKLGWHSTRVHGISVARRKERGKEAIMESLGFLDLNAESLRASIDFYDDFLFGGYGRSTGELQDFIASVAGQSGVILDNTYSGKAFYGMVKTVREQDLKGTLMFWHTGGLFNLMA